jgi:hypothetical protein
MRLHCSVIPTGVHNPRMAANPASDYVSVLNTGLPALPPRMRPGWPVPVAIWNGDRHGAVMVIEDCDHDPYCPRDEHYVAMTYVYGGRDRTTGTCPPALGALIGLAGLRPSPRWRHARFFSRVASPVPRLDGCVRRSTGSWARQHVGSNWRKVQTRPDVR